MGFYNTMFPVKQQDRLTHMFRGGWAPRSQAQPVRVCDIIVLYIMGYYVISNYIPFGGIRIKKLKPPQKRKDKYDKRKNETNNRYY